MFKKALFLSLSFIYLQGRLTAASICPNNTCTSKSIAKMQQAKGPLNLNGYQFDNLLIMNLNLQNSRFEDASFKDSHLYNCNFENVDFSGATFDGGLINKVTFSGEGSSFYGAGFNKTELSDVTFNNIDFSHVDFTDSTAIRNLDFTGCHNLDLSGIVLKNKNSKITLPDGSTIEGKNLKGCTSNCQIFKFQDSYDTLENLKAQLFKNAKELGLSFKEGDMDSVALATSSRETFYQDLNKSVPEIRDYFLDNLRRGLINESVSLKDVNQILINEIGLNVDDVYNFLGFKTDANGNYPPDENPFNMTSSQIRKVINTKIAELKNSKKGKNIIEYENGIDRQLIIMFKNEEAKMQYDGFVKRVLKGPKEPIITDQEYNEKISLLNDLRELGMKITEYESRVNAAPSEPKGIGSIIPTNEGLGQIKQEQQITVYASTPKEENAQIKDWINNNTNYSNSGIYTSATIGDSVRYFDPLGEIIRFDEIPSDAIINPIEIESISTDPLGHLPVE